MAELSHDPHWQRAGNLPAFDLDVEADLVLVGVPTWRTSLSPTGAGVTPDAVRDALRRYSTHAVLPRGGAEDRLRQIELHEAVRMVDAGDVYEPDLDEEGAASQIAALGRSARMVVALGGDNALTVPVALGAAGAEIERAGIITLDAHHDVREGRSNGSPIRRLIERGFDPSRIVQIGIADFANARPYRDFVEEMGITVIHRDELYDRSVDDAMQEALGIAGSAGGPIHVDLDVDVCDRAVVPACPASIPGGLHAHELRRFARLAGAHPQVRSIDIAEVDASADTPDGRTVRLAALLVLEAALGLALRSS